MAETQKAEVEQKYILAAKFGDGHWETANRLFTYLQAQAEKRRVELHGGSVMIVPADKLPGQEKQPKPEAMTLFASNELEGEKKRNVTAY